MLGVLAIGLIVSSSNPQLTNGEEGARSSPWAVATREAGVRGLDSVVNGVTVTSAWSAGNSELYVASRSLYSLAITGNAPRIFARCTKSGIPHYALALSASLSLLAYLNLANTGVMVFNWLVKLINIGAYQS